MALRQRSCRHVARRLPAWIGWAAAGAIWLAFGFVTNFALGSWVLAFLYLMHALVGYVELGTDSWITNITKQVLKSGTYALLAFIWTNVLMFTLRFFAGPIVHKINPIGLAVRQRCARDDRAVPARQAVRRFDLAVDGRGDDLRPRQDVLLADAARGDLRAVPEGRGAGAGDQRRRRHDRRPASSAARASATSRTTSRSRSSKQTTEGQRDVRPVHGRRTTRASRTRRASRS